jgi:hypothetical protein
VAWDQVRREDVLAALREHGRLGAEQFLSQHGYGPSRSYELILGERHYRTRPFSAPPTRSPPGQHLVPGDFEGGKAGAVRMLSNLGFTVQPLAQGA